jgi:hypothetical protein
VAGTDAVEEEKVHDKSPRVDGSRVSSKCVYFFIIVIIVLIMAMNA